MSGLRIAVDALLYNRQPAGIGRYIFELFSAYARLFGQRDAITVIAPARGGWEQVVVRTPRVPVANRYVRLLYEQVLLADRLRRGRFDAVHFPDYQMPVFSPVSRGVLTVHDLVVFRYPEFFPRRSGQVKRYLMAKSVKKAAHIIVPSQATRDDLREILGVPADRITVVPHGVTRRGRPADQPLYDRPYILAVGTVEPRKNFDRLIEAYRILWADRGGDCPDLLIAGQPGWLCADTLAAPVRVGLRDRVRFLRYVSDDDLATLYRFCVGVAYPSLYEGFGFPVLEAMGYGRPVVTSNRGALREVSMNIAIEANPLDPVSIAEGLGQLTDGSPELAERVRRGLAHAATYTWDNAARATREVYLRVAGEKEGTRWASG